MVSLRAHADHRIVSATEAGASPLVAGSTSVGPAEESDLIDS
ncbi:hypothetical protein AB0F71_10315 [Kitasatospora sp. NPDC028055]